MKVEIKNIWGFNQGWVWAGFRSLPPETVKTQSYRTWERGKPTEVKHPQENVKESPTWGLFSSSLTPQMQGSGCLEERSEWCHSFCQSTLKTESSPSGNPGGHPTAPASYITTTFSKLAPACSSRASPEPGFSRLYQLHPAGMWGRITLSDRKGEIKISLFSAVLRVTAQLTAASNNALGANKILRNPFLDCSESFIFISGYQHANKAHIN